MPVMTARLRMRSTYKLWKRLMFVPCVAGGEPLRKCDPVLPPQRVETGHVKQLAGCAVRLARIEGDPRVRIHDVTDKRGELRDCHIQAGANVDVTQIAVLLHQEHAGISKIIDMKEFTARRAAAP